MSKSKNFMIKAEAIARDALTKIQKADADLRSAEQRRNKNRDPPHRADRCGQSGPC